MERNNSNPTLTFDSKPTSNKDLEIGLHVLFGLIAAASFLSNLFFCVVLVTKRSLLKKPHNIVLFSLAVADMLTGVFLVATPGYVIPQSYYPVPSRLRGEIFCRLLANRYLLFLMGKVSLLLTACLAIERWYCVLKPMQYKNKFSRKRIVIYVILMFIVTCILSMNKFFESSASGNKCNSKKAPYGKHGTQAFVLVYCLVAFYVPCFITWFTFAHITLHFPSFPGQTQEAANKRRRQRVLLRMCAITAAALTICGFPAQTIYLLSPFGITKIGSPIHKGFNALLLFHSCINPWIYWSTNKEYRKEFKKFLVCNKSDISPETEFQTADTYGDA
ncbi:blue-sensitive opsin-like [Montipora foliosa]|uniref:blue-sensitive opsin-like n=1 Tax=Montipora foliosa TaxID=591990 RepID=UPI0035F16C04